MFYYNALIYNEIVLILCVEFVTSNYKQAHKNIG